MGKNEFDIIVVGGGINGAGIAADAAGRGLTVLLAEQADLASGTSSASSKLIHGGLRYLENYEFRLVRKALQEREVLLAKAPHIVRPLRFVLPHGSGQRPAAMIRAGLFLYDHLAPRQRIPASTSLDLAADPMGSALKPRFKSGFAYWDCWVDDARMVILNARAAAERGAEICTRTRVTSAVVGEGKWHVTLQSQGSTRIVLCRALVNATGPWIANAAELIKATDCRPPRVRLVKGSHIVVPRIAGAEDAFLFQHEDGRVVFALPFLDSFTMIGTTDVPFVGDPASASISANEKTYLLEIANAYVRTPLNAADIIWSFAGVRPLYDDESGNPSAVTRDYRLELKAERGQPPLLNVLGGKITTYRRLAEHALELLQPFFPQVGPAWTAHAKLPGGDVGGDGLDAFVRGLIQRRKGFDPAFLRRLASRHGSLAEAVLGDTRSLVDLGGVITGDLTAREVAYFRDFEWAREPADVLWRRTKNGVPLPSIALQEASGRIAALLG